MGALPGEPDETSLMEAFVAVAKRAGSPVWIPDDVEGTCCGVPFSSKGYADANAFTVNRAIERFWDWSDGGRLPVVVDTSPCTYGVKASRPQLTPENQAKFDRLTILDGVAFTHDTLLPKLAREAEGGARRPPPGLLGDEDEPRRRSSRGSPASAATTSSFPSPRAAAPSRETAASSTRS